VIRSPFVSDATAPAQGWLAKLLHRPDIAGASAAVERALAVGTPLVPADHVVAGILAAHHVAGSRAREVGIALWLRALHACIADDVVTDEELAYLNSVRLALNLRERDVDELREGETAAVFRAALADALADGRMTDEEWRRVDLIASGMRLSKERRAQIGAVPIEQAMQREIDRALEDRRFTPAENRQIVGLATSLGLATPYTDAQEDVLARALLLWRIENEDLPVMTEPVINLQKGEVCHCAFRANWYELRTRTISSYRSGPVTSLRIMKGLSYRVGNYQTHRVTADEMTLIDQGIGYVTNKRFIFDGAKKNTTIRHTAILSLTPYTDGLAIEKATGKSPTLVIDGDAEIVTAIFAETLSRS
jgi:hypothetical protein